MGEQRQQLAVALQDTTEPRRHTRRKACDKALPAHLQKLWRYHHMGVWGMMPYQETSGAVSKLMQAYPRVPATALHTLGRALHAWPRIALFRCSFEL
jgi:hypothetical protein